MMPETEKLEELLRENLIYIRKITFSKPRDKGSGIVRVSAKPFELKGGGYFSFESIRSDNKAVGENVAADGVPEYAAELALSFSQTSVMTSGGDLTVLVSKKGKMTLINRIKDAREVKAGSHDRKKNYIIDPEESASFLSALGVCDENGNIFDKKRAKFRQINRFTELLDDVYSKLPGEGLLTVCDLCCGKSYLTFAVYHYLTAIKGRSVRMYGVDLKADVIRYCSEIAEKLKFDGLTFLCGDIMEFDPGCDPDLVISLHACDTATDIVLAYAVKHRARMILSTPCCHHEMNRQLDCRELRFIEKHSILRQKLCDAATDSLRALLLEANGYNAEALELIDPEDTPKNVMIRAVKSNKIMPGRAKAALEEYKRAVNMLGVDPTLGKLLGIN